MHMLVYSNEGCSELYYTEDKTVKHLMKVCSILKKFVDSALFAAVNIICISHLDFWLFTSRQYNCFIWKTNRMNRLSCRERSTRRSPLVMLITFTTRWRQRLLPETVTPSETRDGSCSVNWVRNVLSITEQKSRYSTDLRSGGASTCAHCETSGVFDLGNWSSLNLLFVSAHCRYRLNMNLTDKIRWWIYLFY